MQGAEAESMTVHGGALAVLLRAFLAKFRFDLCLIDASFLLLWIETHIIFRLDLALASVEELREIP